MVDNSVLTVAEVAKALRRDNQTIRYLLDNKLVSWGTSFRKRGSKRKSYIIYKNKFQEETGIKIAEGDIWLMNDEIEITNQTAIDALEKLIIDRTKQLNNIPAFLEQERENLKMEIKSYKRHLQKIREVQE